MEERLTYKESHSPLFTHDGIHDSQTHLLAPTYFYKELEREIALSARTGINFWAVRIVFTRVSSDGNRREEKLRAEDVLYFSQALQALTRKEDCVARLGVNECVILVRSSGNTVETLLSRLANDPSLTVNNALEISLSTIECETGENALSFLNRLDQQALSTQ